MAKRIATFEYSTWRTTKLWRRLFVMRYRMNAFVSIITVIGLIFALNLGGSIIVENVFALPGLGQLVATAALRRDYAIIEGGILYFIFVALLVNLAVDVSYSFINPRIRYG